MTKDYAVVTFESQQELEEASSKPFRYNNWLLKWIKKSENRIVDYETSKNIQNKQKDPSSISIIEMMGLDKDDPWECEYKYKPKEDNEEARATKEEKKESKEKIKSKATPQAEERNIWEKIDQHQSMLQEILRRLEKISEGQAGPA